VSFFFPTKPIAYKPIASSSSPFIMRFFQKNRNAETSNATTAVPSRAASMNNTAAQPPADPVADDVNHDALPKRVAESVRPVKIPHVTLRTVFMAILVALGGFIFGYDTGQISGFLEMTVFLERFGEVGGPSTPQNPAGYHFTNVRSGLIVGLVSHLKI
jgi:hypothetical protein